MAIFSGFVITGLVPICAIVYTAVVICYRLFVSPLAQIPGPLLAAATSWYECFYDVYRPGQYVFKIKEMHKRYGPIVRITPREISISDPTFLDTIYTPGPGSKRDKDIEKVKALGINTSIGGAVQHDLHRHRREALNPFFSQKSVLLLEPELAGKIERLRSYFEESLRENTVLNLSDLYFAFSGDIVSQYCFGHNPDSLHNLQRAAARRHNVAMVLRGVKFNLHFSWVRALVGMLPPSLRVRFIPQGIKDMIQFRMRIRNEVERVLSQKSNMGTSSQRSIFQELRDSPTLPKSEKSVKRLEDEATLLVMAGTESTAKSISIAHYHILANPAIMTRLRAELASQPSHTLSELQRLPYVNAIGMEANRLSFGLTGRNARVSPDVPLIYNNSQTCESFVIPVGTPVSSSTILIHTNEELFPDPWTFDPSRWLGPKGQERRKYMIAFSKGPRACIGMNVANAELAMTIAEMSKWDMSLHETDESDVAFLHDYHVATPSLSSAGIRAVVVGRDQQ